MSATILLVEDNPQNRYLATFLLESAGHRVIHAGDGRAALAVARAEKPDLILMDIQMPEMDGYEAAACLKTDPGLASIALRAMNQLRFGRRPRKSSCAGICRLYREADFD
jgi:two-component system cell cycle response regulator DivK